MPRVCLLGPCNADAYVLRGEMGGVLTSEPMNDVDKFSFRHIRVVIEPLLPSLSDTDKWNGEMKSGCIA
jgi:hypothetical protein